RFAYLAERGGGRTLWFDKFVWNEFGQPKAGPEARSAQGFGPWMGRTIPADSKIPAHPIGAGVLRIWRREVVIEPFGSTNSSGTNLDSRRLAPKREARRG
ncbi:MAG: hypothetical protein ABI128_03175, partial [Rhodanobacter sp.]